MLSRVDPGLGANISEYSDMTTTGDVWQLSESDAGSLLAWQTVQEHLRTLGAHHP